MTNLQRVRQDVAHAAGVPQVLAKKLAGKSVSKMTILCRLYVNLKFG